MTDAHVVLGYLNPSAIAGRVQGDQSRVGPRRDEEVGDRLGSSTLEAAHGIYEIASAQMRRAVRSVERGRNPRAYNLLAFGGAGGLHAAALAAELEMREVIVPIAPGLFSSLGLLFSDVAATRLINHRAALAPESMEGLRQTVARLTERATAALRDELSATGAVEIEASIALRYVGQSSSLIAAADCDERG